MKTVKISKKAFAGIAICICTSSLLQAQPGNLNQPPPPPPVNGAPPPQPPPPVQQPLQRVTTYKGVVVKMATNDDYIYDGFYLFNGADSLLVKFPPHLGTQITSAVKKGSNVTVSGVLMTAPMGEKEVRMVSVTANNKTVSDTGMATATPPVDSYTSESGKITQLQTNREGIVNGLILDSKTILRIPPPVASQLNNIAQPNVSISYTGMKKTANAGEVSMGNYAVVHCQTITINGQQYLVR